ncbi:MAG: S9 family peptidase, partial [Tannerella sp.]|nr:S9 family peptidase [Tannerella sp.]
MRKILTLIALFTAMTATQAQIAGDWKGTLDLQGTPLELIFHITGENDQLAATLDVPMQGAAGIPAEATFADNQLTVSVAAAGIKYSGTLAGETIDGNFEQGGMTFPLKLEKFESKLPGKVELVSSEADLKALEAFD